MINLVKVRLSNIELLRILSMLGVLIVHADFGALGEPTRAELLSTPTYTVIRTSLEAFAIVAVNVFVLISDGAAFVNYCFSAYFSFLAYISYAIYLGW